MNFSKSNQFNQSFLHVKLFTLMTIDGNSNWFDANNSIDGVVLIAPEMSRYY